MATRSTIALEFADGTVGQVYCHWDGYLEHNGKILQSYYTDPFKLRELIDLGDLSVLHAELGEKHNFNDEYKDGCTFYGRDRSEDGINARYFKDFADYRANHQYEEYEYILRTDGHWYVADHGDNYVPLAETLIAEAVV
jgi:hypothetical protein